MHPELNLFQKILLSTDGTVTDLIALYTKETIRVTKLEQAIEQSIAPLELKCEAPTRILRRRILLSGAQRNYLYADSQFVFDRFTPWMQTQLLQTDRPIGLLWKDAKLETYREVSAHGIEANADICRHFSLPADSQFVSRTYLIHHAGKPLGAITEKWPLEWFRDQAL